MWKIRKGDTLPDVIKDDSVTNTFKTFEEATASLTKRAGMFGLYLVVNED